MHRYRVPALLILLTGILFLPHLALATIGPVQGGIAGPSNCTGNTYAGWGAFIQVLNNFVQYATYFGVIIAALFVAYGGFLLVLNPMNPENRSKAKSVLINTFIGLFIVLAAWLLVNTLLMALGYTNGGVQGATSVLSGGQNCIAPSQQSSLAAQGQSTGPIGTNGQGTTGNPNAPLNQGGGGACSASNLQQADSSLTNQQANTFACIAKYESSCGTVNQNYNWGNGSSAYGAFQVTLSGNSNCYNNSACEMAAGVSGPLNCKQGFTNGNPIPGSQVAQQCEQAASNLGCSVSAAACVQQQQGWGAWTADSHSSGQSQCINSGG